jgi:hypothetical protein
MKIIALLFSSFFSIGFAYTEAVKEVDHPVAPVHIETEQPALHVILDTVTIKANPVALAVAHK